MIDNMFANAQLMFERFVNQSIHKEYQRYISIYQQDSVWGIIIAIQYIGALIASLFASKLTDRYGRKPVLFIYSNCFVLIGCICGALANNIYSFELLLIGRFISGFASGLNFIALPIYMTECSPDQYRGMMCSMQNLSIMVVTPVANLLSLPISFGNAKSWHYLFVVNGIPSFIMLLISPFFPESPAFLLLNLRNKSKARDVVRMLHSCDTPSADRVLQNFAREQESRKEIGDRLTWKQIWSHRSLRLSFTLCIMLGLMYVFSMWEVGAQYPTYTFLKIGFNLNVSQWLVTAGNMLQIFVAFLPTILLDRFGRKPLLDISNIIFIILTSIFTLCFAINYYCKQRFAFISWIAYAVYMFAGIPMIIGPLALTWFVSTEILPENYRAQGQSVTIFVVWFGSAINTFLYPLLLDSIGPFVYLLFCIIPCVATTIYLRTALPETKQQSVANIVENIAKQYSVSSTFPKWEISNVDKLPLIPEVDKNDYANYGAIRNNNI